MKSPNLLNANEGMRFQLYMITVLIYTTLLIISLSPQINQNSFAQPFSNSSLNVSSLTSNQSNLNSVISDLSNSSTLINSTTIPQESLTSALASNHSSQDESLINLASYAIENRLEKPKAILEILSNLPEVKNLSFANLVDTDETPGIPAESELEKRQIANYILSNHPMDFVSVLFLLPNGDVYLLEPYIRQQNLSTTNLSFRDYFQGVISTNDTYLGNIITSKASGLKQVQLAVPLYAEALFNENATTTDTNSQSNITGILSTGLNLQSLNDILNIVNNEDNNNEDTVVLIDGNGKIIAESSKNTTNLSEDENLFANLKSYKLALNGENGTLVENIHGVERTISFAPVNAISNTWVILMIK